jgi:DNA processing protein
MDNFKKDLILLNMVQDIGYIRFKALLDVFKAPGKILGASFNELRAVKGIGSTIARAVENAGRDYDINREINLIKKTGAKILTLFDRGYPDGLKNIYDPPVVLYVKGDIGKGDELSISIVGSRRCTYYGMNMADKIAQTLALNGITIVSGLARGIDTSAHKGALKAKGRTVAVLGSGFCDIYPAENRPLAEQIAENGALISEFPMQTPPKGNNFPRRNRLISGLSKAVLVVEAAHKSGALITADLALEQGRDVFAVPGMAERLPSMGTNALIKQGARLVDSADDILEELGIPTTHNPEKTLGRIREDAGIERDIYGMLSDKPCHKDVIIQMATIGYKQANHALLRMQIKGLIRQLPGGFYVKTGV